MVDFRYHLVSLIAVFMALAVGIVLGAGPLQNSIGTALTDQVESLRTSRDEARADVDLMTAEVDKYRDGLTAVTPALTENALEGQSIVVIAMPDAPADVVDAHQAALEQAGATIAGKITVASGAISDEAAEYRDTLVTQLRPMTSQQTQERLGSAIVSLVQAGPMADQGLIDLLQSGDEQILELTDALAEPATGILVVAPPTPEVDPEATVEVEITPAAAVELVTSLGSMPTVVVGDDLDGGLVATLRSDEEGVVSTVDSPADPTSLMNAPLALTQELAGGSVAWGLGNGATAVIGSRAFVSPEPGMDTTPGTDTTPGVNTTPGEGGTVDPTEDPS